MDPIIITIGDVGGIGPEVTFKAIQQLTQHPPIIIIMPKEILNDEYYSLYTKNIMPYNHAKLANNTIYYELIISDIKTSKLKNDPNNAKVAYECILKAVELANIHQYNYLVTAPISKEGFANARLPLTGHTTLLKTLYNSTNVSMAFYSNQLKIVLSSIHIPLSEVEASLNKKTLINTIKNTKLFANALKIKSPTIGICGLNPHAGENGLIGKFESDILKPCIDTYLDKDLTLIGPVSPDIIFRNAINGEYDIVIALYHDQGLIPLKLLAFDSAVNVSIGLPICRTSPDHGTAYDIAFCNKANPKSMLEAINYCIKFG